MRCTEHPGRLSAGPPQLGVYVFPDNQASGTLEHLLLEAAAWRFPDLTQRAHALVNEALTLVPMEAKGLLSRSGPPKAKVGVIGSVVCPGIAIWGAIGKSDWLTDVGGAHATQLRQFLRLLLGGTNGDAAGSDSGPAGG